jgi:transcriptional regulator with XRE-family HTH domain
MDFSELGQAISKIRKDKKISQQQLSNDLQISRATISNFENAGSVDIGLRKVLQIIDYLGFKIELKEKSNFPIFEELLNG